MAKETNRLVIVHKEGSSLRDEGVRQRMVEGTMNYVGKTVTFAQKKWTIREQNHEGCLLLAQNTAGISDLDSSDT